MCNCVDCHIIFKQNILFISVFYRSQDETCSVKCCTKTKLSKRKQEKSLDLIKSKTAKLTDFFTQVPQHDIQVPDQNQSSSSEVDTKTTLITSKSKYDDVGIIEVSQAGSSSACLTTGLTLPASSLDTSTTNIDASCFIVHSGVETIAENESLVGHGDGGEMIQSAKDEVKCSKRSRVVAWFLC